MRGLSRLTQRFPHILNHLSSSPGALTELVHATPGISSWLRTHLAKNPREEIQTTLIYYLLVTTLITPESVLLYFLTKFSKETCAGFFLVNPPECSPFASSCPGMRDMASQKMGLWSQPCSTGRVIFLPSCLPLCRVSQLGSF